MLAAPGGYNKVTVGPAGAGAWTAELTWNDAAGLIALEVFRPDGSFVGRGERPTGDGAGKTFTWSGSAGDSFRVDTYLQLPVSETYVLRVISPNP